METWIPDACTLPSAERPVRVAEFEALLGEASAERLGDGLLRLTFDAAASPAVRDLTARESACCSFFTFTVRREGDAVVLDVAVPSGREPVLDALARLARPTLRSGQVAARAGVNVQTLRYYERRGLLPRPARSAGGHRVYPAETVARLRLIKAAQRLGFTLDEIAALLARAGLHERATAKLAEIDARIRDLTAVRTTLAAVAAAGCDDLTHCTSPDCPRPFSVRLRTL